jgi:isocitrate dehydrogenase
LGEFLALAVSLDHLGETFDNPKASIIAEALDDATDKLIENKKGPSRKVNELDNRGSHFYLAMYWAEALASQDKDQALRERFTPITEKLKQNESKIIHELNDVQGSPIDMEGYYEPNDQIVSDAMRPSATFNNILNEIR